MAALGENRIRITELDGARLTRESNIGTNGANWSYMRKGGAIRRYNELMGVDGNRQFCKELYNCR